MLSVKRTTSANNNFKELVNQLDAYLKITDGDKHDFYNQFNGIENLDNVVLVYNEDVSVGCGAFKPFDKNSVEIKRMFVLPKQRVGGIGRMVLNALEDWAKELGYTSCVLEIGKRQIEALQFYKKCDYKAIPKYGQYVDMDNSLCFKKDLN